MKAIWSLWVAPLLLALSGAALAADAPRVAMEEFMVPAVDPGIRLDVRNKHPEGVSEYPAEIGEGTHTVIMEKNRMQLFQAVQQFLDERLAPSD